MSLDGNFKLFCFIEDIMEILGVQLGPEEGVTVHYSKSVTVLRVSGG